MKKCKWCGIKFKSTSKNQMCCCTEHDSKYSNYVSNDRAEKPWDIYTDDNYKYNYY